MKLIAQITPDRTLTLTPSNSIQLCWDHTQINLSYSQFAHFVSALKSFRWEDYATAPGFCIVSVDENATEVWIGETCLTLTACECRSLIDATLSAQTRLLGLVRPTPQPDSLAHIDLQPVGIWGRPQATFRTLN